MATNTSGAALIGDGTNFNNKKTTMNFIRSLADKMHYQDIDNPFYKKHKFDGKIGYIHIYRNIYRKLGIIKIIES